MAEQPGSNHTMTLIAQASSGIRSDGPVDLWADKITHRLLVDAGTITTSSATAGLTGAAVPTSADYIGVNSGGNLVGLTVGQATMANSLPVAIASNQSNLPTNIVQVGGASISLGQALAAASLPVILPSATITTLTPPSNSGYALDTSLTTIDTDLKANITLHAGSNIIGKVTTDQTTHGTTDLVAADITKVGGSAISLGQKTMANSFPITLASDQGNINVQLQTATSGGWSPSSQTALTSTKTQVKGSAGQLGGYMFYNPNSTIIYIQVFDVASGSITVGTTAPTYVIPLPPLSAANIEFTQGIAHATAINIAATTTPTGASAPTTALTGFFLFK